MVFYPNLSCLLFQDIPKQDIIEQDVAYEISENANTEAFIPQPETIEEKPKQPTVAETVKTEEKEPIPAAEPVETEIPSFMSQEEMQDGNFHNCAYYFAFNSTFGMDSNFYSKK